MDNLIHYVEQESKKTVIINLSLVAAFKEGPEPTPRLWISYPNSPTNFFVVPYLWKDFLKNFYPDK